MFCEECGNELKEGQEFCSKCGAKRKAENTEEILKVEEKTQENMQEEKVFCAECGTKLEKDEAFCSKCGTKRDTKEEQEPVKTEFCGNCGAKLEAIQMFCSQCGASKTGTVQTNKEQEVKPKPKKKAFWIILILLVVILGGGYYYLNTITSPDAVMEKFKENMQTGNFSEMYSVISLPESKYINQEIFDKYMEENMSEDTVSEFEFSLSENKSNESKKIYDVKIDGDETNITLTKNANKKYFLFDDWNIELDGIIVEEWKISVPVGSTLYVDNIEVKEEKETNNDVDTYILKNVLNKYYNVRVTNPLTEDYERELSTYRTQSVQLEAKEDLEEELIKSTEDFVENFYTSILQGKDISSTKEYCKDDESYKKITQASTNIKNAIVNGLSMYYNELQIANVVVDTYEISNVKVQGSDTVTIDTSIALKFDYLFSDSSMQNFATATRRVRLSITLTKSNDIWKITNIK